MYDIIIIGAGPGGVSASLYAKRANMNVLVLYYGESQLEKAHLIENYYGFEGGIGGKELYENGIAQAKALGVDVKNEEVLNVTLSLQNTFEVTTNANKYSSKALVISTGNKKITPDIKGADTFEGRGISYCAICDGFFYRKKKVAVLGNEDYALSEAAELENIVGELVILTDGLEPPKTDKYEIITKKISEFVGEAKISKVVFDDGSELELDGVFVAQGTAGGADFAKKLGIKLLGSDIKVNEDMSTNVKGVFACGNVTGGLLQVGKAVYEGSVAGLSAVKYVKSINKKGE